MDTLRSLFPKAETLLPLEPDDLAPVLLRLARYHRQGGGMFWPKVSRASRPSLVSRTGGRAPRLASLLPMQIAPPAGARTIFNGFVLTEQAERIAQRIWRNAPKLPGRAKRVRGFQRAANLVALARARAEEKKRHRSRP